MSEQHALNSTSKNNDNLNTNNNVNPNSNNNVIENDNNVKTERKRKNDNMNDNESAKHLKNNYYSVLDCEKDEQCDRELLKKFEKYINNKNNKEIPQCSHSATETTNKNSSKILTDNTVINLEKCKTKKIPPINIVDIDTKQLIEFIKHGLKINEFNVKEFRNKKSLFMNSLHDFHRVKAYLEKTNTKFFTFTPKDLKIKTYLLKGIDANIDPDEILFELLKFESDELKFIKVSKFSTKSSIEKGIKLPMFLVQVTAESHISKLKNIKTLLHRIVKWEQVRRPEIPQCRNCQDFFHSAANCYLPRRCVKCNNNHERGKCPIEKVEDKEKLFCVLCNKYGHPASYKGCEKYKELKNKINNKRKDILVNKSYNTNVFTNPEASFAKVVKGNNSQDINRTNNNSDNTNTNSLLQEIKNFMININTQMVNLQKQLNLQVSRIDTIFSMLEV